MPLGGLFGGGGTSKARPLTQTDSGGVTTKEKPKKDFGDKDARGTVLKLQNHTVIVDKKLAEGGFAIVYLVTDRQNRHYALKRQFVSDDPRQVEACKRECQIINSLKGHKNIVHYVDHILTRNKSGVFDYMLLTVYYKNSILGVMNERLASGKSLSPAEVLAIFCDMCEAVARLHHSHTPVIHRDLKVENILVDERNRGAPPIYVLCDFGSATTKVFSSEIHPVSVVQEEIEKYTTLSYRAPEMIDVYSGKPIGTKADIWAMGVMLFKLIYFSLPFGDSAMAIQNGAFSFPSQPTVPASLRAIIKALLVSDLELRPNIYQTAQLAFEAANLPNPVQNIERASVPSLSALVSAMEIGSTTPLVARQKEQPKEPVVVPQEGDLLTRVTSHPTQSLTTSVNPRLRPKPSNGALKLEQSFPAALVQNASVSEPDFETGFDSQNVANVPDQAPLSCPLTQPTTSHFTQIADSKVTESVTIVQSSDATVQSHRRHASDCSAIKSAFRPYSKVTTAQANSQSNVTVDPTWNPFTAAPFGDNGKSMMDDKCFGQFFDELPRKPAHADDGGSPPSEFLDDSSVDMTDPFGAAPFDLPSDKEDDEDPLVDNDAQIDGPGTVMVHDESSDMDEVRVACCRRFSYEHIDGVGDDASSDSRARTEEEEEEDSNTDDQRLDDDDDIDKSQTTEGAVTDEEAGNRPLLDDDELEHDYEDHDALWMELSAKKCTNPFLVPPTTRQYPNQQTPTVEEDRGIITPEAPSQNRSLATFAPIDIFQAPATLPRQVTPLFSVPRTQAKQHLPNENVPLHSPRPSAPPLPSSALVVASKYPPQAGEVAQTAQKPVIGDLSIQNEISIDPFTSPLDEHPQKSPLAPPVPQMRRETAPETVLRAELGYDGGALPPPPPHRKNTLPDGGIGQGPDSLQSHWREAVPIDPFPLPPIPPARRETLPVASPRVLRREVVPEIHTDAPLKETDTLRRGSVPSPTLTASAPCYSAVHAIASSSAVTSSAKSFGFNSPLMKNKKKAREVLKRENSSTSTDSPQTDDSGTEIFYTSSSKSEKHKSKKKTKSGHKNHPSVAPLEITPRPALPVKGKKIPSAAKRGSSGTVNASFVNSSFQPEDADCSVEPL